MYVGPGGNAAFGKRYKWPGAPAQPAAAAKPAAATTAPKPAATLGPAAVAQLGNKFAGQNPGWTPPAGTVPAGVNLHPGAAGERTAPVPPYMTGPDIINYGDAFKSHEDQIAQSDKDLGDIKAWAQTALFNIGRNYLQGTDNTQNDAAARGLFQSSIKDGALADLGATKASMTSDVNTRVDNAQLFRDSAVKRINDWWSNFQEGMNNIKASNAAAAGADAPPYVAGQEPTSATFTAPGPATTAPSAPSPPAAAAPNYTGAQYSLTAPGKPKYRLGGYQR